MDSFFEILEVIGHNFSILISVEDLMIFHTFDLYI